MKFGLLLIRVMLGITFTIHGAQKAIGGFHEPMTMMSNMGFPAFVGILLGLFELVGGIMMIVGLLTNYIAIGFIVIMLGAHFTVHLPQGYMASELPLLLLVMSIAIAVSYQWKKLFQPY